MSIQFKQFTGDINWQEYGGKFISKKFNNGDFDYYLVLNFVNTEGLEEISSKYHLSLDIVAPTEFEDLNGAMSCVCFSEWGDENNPIHLVDAIHDYSGGVTAWWLEGDNYKELFKEAHKQAMTINGLFGFVMDRAQNRIGSDGWDFIKGDIMAGLNK